MGKRIQELVLKDLNKKVLELGYVGENVHTQIIIDCSEVFWDYPNAVPRLNVTPPRGDKYPASNLVKDGDNLIWTITDSDVIYSGSGRIQLKFVDGNEIIKTAVGTTKIDGSIETTGDAPTPLEDWMDRAEETAEQIAETAAATVLENYDELVDDVTSLKSAFEQLNDNVIVDSAGPASIVSIADGADGMPMRSVEVAIEPVQDLHGYDSPWPAGGGKNKAHITYTSDTVGGITITVNSDGTFTTNGTASEDKTILIGTYDGVPGTGYILTGCPSGGGASTYRLFASSLGNDTGNGRTGTYNSGATNISLQFYAGANMNGLTFKPMVRVSSESDATFAPYSNICPITGWTGAKVTRTGKNLLSYTPSKLSGSVSSLPLDKTRATFLKAGQTYKLSFGMQNATTWRIGALVFDFDGNRIFDDAFFFGENSLLRRNASGKYYVWSENLSVAEDSITPKTDCFTMLFWLLGDTTDTTIMVNSQIELGSTATAYEPYQGQTYEVTFPSEAGTVYGGTLDVASGKLVVDRAIVVVSPSTGNLKNNGQSSNTTRAFFTPTTAKKPGLDNFISNRFNRFQSYDSPGLMIGRANSGGVEFYIPVDVPDTSSGVTSWFAENETEYLYELNQSVEVTLDATEILTLLGTNNIWADAGNTAITYPADTKLYIDKKIAELQALILENNG